VKKSFDSEALFARVSRALEGRLEKPRAFEAVAEAAQPFLAALIVRTHPRKRFWVDCPDVRAQENFAAELAAWCGGTRIFAEMDVPVAGESLPDPETAAERLEILRGLGGKDFRGPLVIHRAQWEQDVPASEELAGALLRVGKGEVFALETAVETLAANGYERAAQVATRGQFAIRGGIFDVFSWQASQPFRIELDDDTVDSIRVFDPHTQISTEERDRIEILTGRLDRKMAPLKKYRRKEDIVLSVGEGDGILLGVGGEDPAAEFFPQPFADFGAGDLVLDAVRRDRFFRQIEQWRVDDWMVVIAANSEGEIERFRELAEEHEFETDALKFLKLPVARGFVFPAGKLAVLSDAELFGRSAVMRSRRLALRRERVLSGRAAVDFTEFEPGDYVVHLEYGVGKFIGLQKPSGTDEGEVLVLEYAGEARLYVPLDQAWQVARYVGLGKRHPDLSDLNDGRWQRAKQKVQQSIFDYASRMLKLQAERDTTAGHACGPDTHWQQEFEDAFPYDETTDQLRAISESKADMESDRPMDRLICGDVGFGKTEVAIRAIFKSVMGNRQAALLAPTTVLAQQHYQTLRERMSDYPIRVELLSRYRTAAEQQKVVKGLITGEVDVVVGTHRLVSPDVAFKNLGLVVVDEEQRFGVKHKELLKERFRQVDVLTLSATPIPRTLYMALMGARDMSVIDTPPANRQPVETVVCAYDERVFRDAIQRELARGGQVYFLHNRVSTIEGVAARIRELCPGARVVYGHGQMNENELEPVMQSFVAGEADVLVSTTIIESGLDIPNANTIIIDRADLFGLADLYQLRGRVGRAQAKAHAYLMLPRDLMGAARKRVSAIKQYSDLGSGFKIAMRDLEIRGAGNLLGTAQSGHIIAVGFDLYCKLLKHAVDTLKGVRKGARVPSGLRLDFLTTDEAQWRLESEAKAGAFLSTAYVSDPQTRIACYRRLAEAQDRPAIDTLRTEWRDRFGPLPVTAENALLCALIRLEAARRRISMVESRDGRIMLTQRKELLQPGGRFPRLTSSDPDSRLREILTHLDSLPAS
jgi:transcription-repair coupling factor (superfamily II helicase)